MSLKFRRFLYLSFIILFFLLSGITIFYTAGYRYHLKKEKFQKNGGLFLEFKPHKTKIYINGKLKKTTGFFENSFRLTELLPGEYTVKIDKEGYFPWEKTINIETEKINFIKNIILFKNTSLPQLEVEGEIDSFSLLPQNNLFLIKKNLKNKYLSCQIYNLKNQKIVKSELLPFSTDKINYSLSPQKNKILLIAEGKHYIYNNKNNKIIELEKKFKKIKISDIRWSKNSDNLLFFINKNNIYEINLLDYTLQQITSFSENKENLFIKDFEVIDNKIYLIKKTSQSFSLEEINQESLRSKILLNNIGSDFKLVRSPSVYLTLFNSKNNFFQIINTATKEIILEDKGRNILWSEKLEKENYKITYNNDFEIFVFNVNENEKYLLTRAEKTINQICWYPDYNHILFSHDYSINIIDLDKNNKKIINTFFQGGTIKNINVNSKGDIIYWNGNIGNQIGIFKLQIL